MTFVRRDLCVYYHQAKLQYKLNIIVFLELQ